MNIEYSKNFENKTSLNFRKTFQYNGFLNIFDLTTGTNEAENHLSNMELLINEDMYDVAIPKWVMEHSSTFQCDRISCLHLYFGACSWRVFEKQERANQPNGQDYCCCDTYQFL